MLLIRPAVIDDVPLLRALIRELAEFERELELCVIQEADLARDGFGPHARFHALMAEWSGEAAGYALFFPYYSTWGGRGTLSGRCVCAAAVPGQRHWHGIAGGSGSSRRAGELQVDAMGSLGLE
jgi:hypothetical protein